MAVTDDAGLPVGGNLAELQLDFLADGQAVRVAVDDLGHQYLANGKVINVLQNVSLDVGVSKMVAVQGESGSGKTTLLLACGAMQQPTTGKVIIVHSANRMVGVGAEIAALIAEELFESLDGPIVRLGGADTPIPFSPPLEDAYRPNADRIATAIRKLAAY